MQPDPNRDTLASRIEESIVLPAGTRLLTVDVEEWFDANFSSVPVVEAGSLPRLAESSVAATLELLAHADVRGTFFILGAVAREHRGLVARIAAEGHEIACHSLDHDLIYETPPERFARDLDTARKLLQDQSGQPILGFRAPSWSITQRSLWALDIIAEAGFRYDSSVFPAPSPLYGIAGAPTGPYRLRTTGAGLLELPPSVLRIGPLRLGVGGGFYLRALPLGLQRMAMQIYARRGESFMVYVHPRELDPTTYPHRLPLSTFDQLIHRFGLSRTPSRLRGLLREGGFGPVAAALETAGLLRVEDS